MPRRNKGLFEPDYRFSGWNQVKDESRGCFTLAELGALIIFIGAFSIGSQNFLFALFTSAICVICLNYCARKFMQSKVDKINEAAQQIQIRSIRPTSLNIDQFDSAYDLTPTGLEYAVAVLFEQSVKIKNEPIRAQVVGGAGDGGIDIKLWDKQHMLVGIVQVKRYAPNTFVPPTHIRDFDSVRRRLGVYAAYFVTTAKFSEQSRSLARECNIRLVDGDELRACLKNSIR